MSLDCPVYAFNKSPVRFVIRVILARAISGASLLVIVIFLLLFYPLLLLIRCKIPSVGRH